MASSSSRAQAGKPPQVPTRTFSKRGRQETEKEYDFLRLQVEDARKKIKPSHSFDAKYWILAANASDLSVQLHEKELNLSIQKWKEECEGEDTKSWWATPEAHRIVDKMKAARYERIIYQQQAERIEKGGLIRRSFQSMFTTSQMGVGIQKTGVGKRSRSEQSKFKNSLINFYDAATTNPKKHKVILSLHDSATGRELLKNAITAAHIVPHSLGGDMLQALFGANVEGELDTPYNGLLLETNVEKAMDDGAIAIVPDISDDPSTEEITMWEAAEPKNYKWKIIDVDAEVLDEPLEIATEKSQPPMTIRDLNGQQLSFKNDMRPRARYLYFLFVVAHLRLAWRQDFRHDPSKVLQKQLGKGFWATKGRYLKRSFLLALAEEIGHDTDFAENIPIEPGDDNEPDETGVLGIAKLLQFPGNNEDDGEDEGSDK
ncbi:hypothetical protein MGN70_006026 [Eutypa lata]|nr:hypothetical protein MGN70_006026 [Eutypa lata]